MKRAYEVIFETYHRPSSSVAELRIYIERDDDHAYDADSITQQAFDTAKEIVGKGAEIQFTLDRIREVVG